MFEGSLPTHPLFTYTLDMVGVQPTKPLLCPRCKAVDGEDEIMLFRLSELGQSPELNNWVIDVQFKCPRCNMVMWHGLPTTQLHFRYVLGLREKHGVKLPTRFVPKATWAETDNREAVKRLEALGYF